MREFFQGSVDTFCGAYAVFNALQITHGLKALQARGLLTQLLLLLAKDEMVFTRILTLKTDYVAMVEVLLELANKEYPIKVTQPFEDNCLDKDRVWKTLADYLNPDEKRTAVFQFEKRLALAPYPIFAHWTTAWNVHKDELRLYDCSPEINAVKVLHKKKTCMQETTEGEGEYLCLNARTIRFIEAV